MLFPKKVKYRKWHSNRRSVVGAKETRGTEISFGSFGLKAMAPARIRSNQIEAARRAMSHHVGKNAKIWTRIFPDKPFTMKAAETPMGKGKGDPAGYEFLVKPGRVLFEVDGIPEAQARESLRKAGTKLPVKTKVVAR